MRAAVVNSIGVELIEIPGREFTMGSPAGDLLATTPDSGTGEK